MKDSLLVSLLEPDRGSALHAGEISLVSYKCTDILDLVLDHCWTFEGHSPAEYSDTLWQTHRLEHFGAEDAGLV